MMGNHQPISTIAIAQRAAILICFLAILIPQRLVSQDSKHELSLGTAPIAIDGVIMRRLIPPLRTGFIWLGQSVPRNNIARWSGDGQHLFVTDGQDAIAVSYPYLSLTGEKTKTLAQATEINAEGIIRFLTDDFQKTAVIYGFDFSERFRGTVTYQSREIARLFAANREGIFTIARVDDQEQILGLFSNSLRDGTAKKLGELAIPKNTNYPRPEEYQISRDGRIVVLEIDQRLSVYSVADQLRLLGTTPAYRSSDEARYYFSQSVSPDGAMIVIVRMPMVDRQRKNMPAKLFVAQTSDPSKFLIETDLEFPGIKAAYSRLHDKVFISAADGTFWQLDPRSKEFKNIELPGAPYPILEIEPHPTEKCVLCAGQGRLLLIE